MLLPYHAFENRAKSMDHDGGLVGAYTAGYDVFDVTSLGGELATPPWLASTE